MNSHSTDSMAYLPDLVAAYWGSWPKEAIKSQQNDDVVDEVFQSVSTEVCNTLNLWTEKLDCCWDDTPAKDKRLKPSKDLFLFTYTWARRRHLFNQNMGYFSKDDIVEVITGVVREHRASRFSELCVLVFQRLHTQATQSRLLNSEVVNEECSRVTITLAEMVEWGHLHLFAADTMPQWARAVAKSQFTTYCRDRFRKLLSEQLSVLASVTFVVIETTKLDAPLLQKSCIPDWLRLGLQPWDEIIEPHESNCAYLLFGIRTTNRKPEEQSVENLASSLQAWKVEYASGRPKCRELNVQIKTAYSLPSAILAYFGGLRLFRYWRHITALQRPRIEQHAASALQQLQEALDILTGAAKRTDSHQACWCSMTHGGQLLPRIT